MASAAVGYARSLGADGPPGAWADLELADCFLLIGTNTADCHPSPSSASGAASRTAPDGVTRDRGRPALDPDRRPGRSAPGAAAGLGHRAVNAMLHVLWRDELLDQRFIDDHTAGWDARARDRRGYPPERGGGITGLSPESIVAAAPALRARTRGADPVEHGDQPEPVGTDKNAAILNLHLATGPDRPSRRGSASRSPASPTRWAGGRPAASPICCRATAPSRDATAPRRRRAALGRAAGTIAPGRGARRSRSSRGWPIGRGPRGLDHLHQPRGLACRTWTWSRRRFATPSW